MKKITLLLFTPLFFIGLSCTKEIAYEKIIPERQANEKITEAVIQIDTNQMTFAKSGLGKAFIMIPTMTSSGRHPDVNFIRPMIVSFEKAGDNVALFNLTSEQLYDTIPSHRLMQTFKLRSENETSFIIDLGQGFTSFDSQESLTIAEKNTFEKAKRLIESGEESSLEVKDSFVRKAYTTENALFIDQDLRITKQTFQDLPDPRDPNGKLKTQLVAQESTETVTFEIKPYKTHSTFHPAIYDKDQRIGYFINFAVQKQQDEPVPQITKWDIDPSLEPITVRINASAPALARPAMNEGILYWNRVAGREILKIGEPFKTEEKQVDRSIHVYWIPWDSAGFARAGVQADPVTGEILRGQVFMTSSWYTMTQEAFKLALGSGKSTSPNTYGRCILDQSQMLDERLRLSLENPFVEKAAVDTIRIVLAHEMGHVLGLRHNFAGSSTSALSDSQYISNHDRYLQGQSETTVPTSTTVMDYTRGIDTAINGAAILNQPLPYDVAAISWGYLDKKIDLPKYQYCSDEHVMLAATEQKTIYGCERFDSHKNIFLGRVDQLIEDQTHLTSNLFMMLLYTGKGSKSFYTKTKTLDEMLTIVNFSIDAQSSSLDSILYKDPTTMFVLIPAVIDSFLQSLSGFPAKIPTDLVVATLTSDASAAGGFSGIVDRLFELEVKAGGKFYEQQVTRYFDTVDGSIADTVFSRDELDIIKAKMLEKAISADGQFQLSVIKSFPFSKSMFSQDPVTKEYKMAVAQLGNHLTLGNLDQMISVTASLYEKALRKSLVKAKINGNEKEYGFLNPYDSDMEPLRNNFAPSNRPVTMNFENLKIVTAGLEKMKIASVANTVDICKTAGQYVPESANSTQLTEVVSHIDWSQISGVTLFNLTSEIAELKKLEDLK